MLLLIYLIVQNQRGVSWTIGGISTASGFTACMMQNDYDERTPHPESLAKSEDCENYHAFVRTHKDFGCNQWNGHELLPHR